MNLFYAALSADDQYTSAERGERNLHVKTDVVEFNTMFEFSVPAKVPVFGNIYANVGAGMIYFEPKAELNGVTYKLRPLGTEGQNYKPGMSQYSRFTPIIPFSLGKRFYFPNGQSLAMEVGMRKTFTDYLDDVSTVYADPAQVAEHGGAAAGALSDRSDNGFAIGSQRGDSRDMDNYFIIGLKYSFNISTLGNFNKSCSFGNSWFNLRGGRPKFNRRGRVRRGIF